MVKIEIELDNKKTKFELENNLDKNIENFEKIIEDLEKKDSELTNEAKEKLKNEDRETTKNIMIKKR